MNDEDRRRAVWFDDADVARAYAYRPPYAPALYDFLLGLVPQRYGLVDLGCGPGKIAAELAPHFETVIGIDPSGAMIEEARRLHARPNTTWLHASAEDADLPPAIDLVTAGTAIHWMRHDVLFPKLAQRTALVAIVTGDAPQDPPWQAQWRALMTRWLSRCYGVAYDETAFQADGRSYEPWLDIAGRKQFRFTFRQSLNDFIACQHSRASWARSRMGEDHARQFDEDLKSTLEPWSRGGPLTLDLVSELVWGAPRRTC